MAHDPGPCGPQFEDWEDAYQDWENKDSAADSGMSTAGVLTGIGVVTCGGTWWTGVGLLGCGTAVAGALWGDKQSIDASRARNKAHDELMDAKKAYEDCVSEHKWYYRE